jgi:hypothetical protein
MSSTLHPWLSSRLAADRSRLPLMPTALFSSLFRGGNSGTNGDEADADNVEQKARQA